MRNVKSNHLQIQDLLIALASHDSKTDFCCHFTKNKANLCANAFDLFFEHFEHDFCLNFLFLRQLIKKNWIMLIK